MVGKAGMWNVMCAVNSIAFLSDHTKDTLIVGILPLNMIYHEAFLWNYLMSILICWKFDLQPKVKN